MSLLESVSLALSHEWKYKICMGSSSSTTTVAVTSPSVEHADKVESLCEYTWRVGTKHPL